jgi:MFS family permease
VRPDWISRDVWLLMIARGAMSAGRSLAGVIAPIYLARIGFSATRLGVLFALVAITSAALSALSGLLSDRLGRKPFIIAVPVLVSFSAVVFSISHATALIFIFAALGSFGRGAGAGGGTIGPYQPVEQALIADATPAQHRNSVFGRLAFASALGALIGGLLARIPDAASQFGLHGTDAYRPAFLLVALLALLAALLAMPVADIHAARREDVRWIAWPRQSWGFLVKLWITNSVNGVAVGFVGPFLTYWFYRRYGAGPGTIGLLYAAINALSMFSNLTASTIARRLGVIRSITVGRAVQASLLAVMALAPTFWLAGAVYAIRVLAMRVAMPLRQSYVLGMVPSEERASVGALSNLPSQGTSAASPVLAGYLFEHAALAIPFEIGALFQGLQTVIFYAFFRHLPPPEEQRPEAHIIAVDEDEPATTGRSHR